ncbi:MAG: DUF115 domain-containing protein [Acidobacteria bacterium]|nr:DUF115 domain-containing protein [Acidobacteriota bacterium]
MTPDPAASLPVASAPLVRIESGRQVSQPLASVSGPDGEWVALHDARDPMLEARVRIARIAAASPPVVVILGAGLGYVTEAAHERWPAASIVVLEPLPELARAALSRTPAMYADGRLTVLIGPEFDGAAKLWRTFDRPEAAADLPVVVHDGLARLAPEAMLAAARLMKQSVASARMNARARADNAGRYVLNTLTNLAHLRSAASPAVLVGRFADVPAVVVGAGPSLDGQLAALAALAGRALIVSTDTAWRPLVAAGIDPHLVVAIDPTPENGRHLRDVPARRSTWVMAEGSVDPQALEPLTGRVGLFRVGEHHPWPWLAGLGVNRPVVRAWGSVLTSAFDLAIGMGCGPVVFVGADLAYTDGRPYCRGTAFDHDWARYAAQGVSLRQIWQQSLAARPRVEEPGLDGRPVVTAPHFLEFRNWIVTRAQEAAPRRVSNATGAGILHGPGIVQATLEEALAGWPERDAQLRDRVAHHCATPPDAGIGPVLDAALAGVEAAARSGSGPLPEWLSFGRPTLTTEAVLAAAANGHRGLSRQARLEPSAPVATDLPPPRWHEADRVAASRARLTGDEAVIEGTRPPATDPRPPGETLAHALDLAARVLARPGTVAAAGEDLSGGGDSWAVPLSARFTWSADARPLVAALEEDLLAAGAVTAHGTSDDDAARRFYDAPIVPVVDGVDAEPDADGVDRRARAAIACERVTLQSQLAPIPTGAGGLRTLRLIGAARRALGDRRFFDSRALALPVPEAAGPALDLPLKIDALMRALTGTLVRPSAGPDPRTGFLRDGLPAVPPIVAPPGSVGPGWSVAAWDATHAVFTEAQQSYSWLLSEDGACTRLAEWPRAISAQVPWGEGGALAWNAVTADAFVRRADGDIVVTERLPFLPVHVAWGGDDGPVWCARDRAIWHWTPGTAPRRGGELPAAGFLRTERDQLTVAPVVRNAAGVLERRRLDHEFRRLGDQWTRVAAPTEGQCARVAAGAGWQARSHPFGDLVRLDRADGASFRLACYSPLGVAWAGATLAVTTSDGTLLIFPRLADVLETLAAGNGFAAGEPS